MSYSTYHGFHDQITMMAILFHVTTYINNYSNSFTWLLLFKLLTAYHRQPHIILILIGYLSNVVYLPRDFRRLAVPVKRLWGSQRDTIGYYGVRLFNFVN